MSRPAVVLVGTVGAILLSAFAIAEPQSASVLTCDRLKPESERGLATVVATNGQSEVATWYLVVAARRDPGQPTPPPQMCDPRASNCSGPQALPVDVPPVEVLTATAEWSCIATNRRGVLWIPSRNLKSMTPLPHPELSDWLGHWVQGDGYIDITSPDGQQLVIHGENKWPGVGDNVHVGEIQFSTVPKSNPLTLAHDSCEVTMTLVDEYLMLHDNEGCGGANVRFQSAWQRSPVGPGEFFLLFSDGEPAACKARHEPNLITSIGATLTMRGPCLWW